MKRENSNNNNNNNVHNHNGMLSSSLKVHKVSHAIKRSSHSLPSSSSGSVPLHVISTHNNNNNNNDNNNQRGPVIIYTHSPKVIHTNPRDFMSLVQKLTGMSRPKDVNVSTSGPNNKSSALCGSNNITNDKMIPNIIMTGNCLSDNNSNSSSSDDNESSSVITEENGCSDTMGEPVDYLDPCVEAGLFGPPSQPSLGPLLVPDLPFHGPSLYCKTGDSLPVYDYMNYNFACYNQST